jgi:hypothetical protein
LVDLKELLLLTLALTLGLSTGSSDEVFFFLLGDWLGVGPLLVNLVWLTGFRDTGTKSELLLSLLSEVIGVRDAVIFGLGLGSWLTSTIGGSGITITGQSLLLIGLGNGFTSLLVVEFGFTIVSTPAVSSLLLGFAEIISKFAHV